MKKVSFHYTILVLILSSVCWNPELLSQGPKQEKSFVQRQLDRLAQSWVVRKTVSLKNLPGAINRCFIKRVGCTKSDKEVVNLALVKIPLIMAAFATAVGITWSAMQENYSYAPLRGRNKLSDYAPENIETLKNNFVIAVNSRDVEQLKKWFQKLILPLSLINDLAILASQAGDVELVDLLFNEGAQPGAQDGKGNTILYWVARRSTSSAPYEKDQAEKIIMLLLQKKVSVNKPGEDGKTPLMWVAGAGNIALVKFLLQAEADSSIKDKAGKTAADYAQNPEVLRLLGVVIEHG